MVRSRDNALIPQIFLRAQYPVYISMKRNADLTLGSSYACRFLTEAFCFSRYDLTQGFVCMNAERRVSGLQGPLHMSNEFLPTKYGYSFHMNILLETIFKCNI